MAVNHFLYSDEQLLEAFKNFIETNTDVHESRYLNQDDDFLIFRASKHKEYWEIKKELLERMKR